ncbi:MULTISPECIES: cytochrome P450 [Mycobacteriaceae]|uniref:Steroid C26-monooxygenase n=1 Tax=Mycolicibacterium neoaurum VKM Ac-1815D TaxID=700508 RepID=V5XHC2_MYCNE|nr:MULTISPECIES: cytochrome P450 [Mycobacteriaceae]AHC27427.1 cytochrome P450 [Mycolicibacterium neoaurum VKM Ac-1815D]AMO07641.1 cytochrome P450 [Mycolicibacterium neoaurum]AXK73971.1 cytochrome P450 [Mycolicibacterium neoaurum]KJQ51594.1 cytochrome P450 [Mycolicibacterium neoaurum]KUM08828.1 cytochrome [Mycolicibacterium neoaurum]
MTPAADPPRLPFAREGLFTPSSEHRALQARGTIHRVLTAVGDSAWLVTGYEAVRLLFDDERVGRAHRDPENASRTGESAFFGGPIGNFDTEHADHARGRRLMQRHFAPKQMRALVVGVRANIAELLDEMLGQGSSADFYAAMALPLPMRVLCELLGVPHADRDDFRMWTAAATNTRDNARSQWGIGQLYMYGTELVGRKRREPGDDVISRLCATDGVTDHEIASQSMALLLGGHETTVIQLSLATLLLLTRRDQWELLVRQPNLVGNAVEETLRASRTGGGEIPRYAREDFEIGAAAISAGDLLLLDVGAANHDQTVFDDPDLLDIARNTSGHLTFGHGARYCVGAPLARLQLTEVITALVDRVPSLHLGGDISELVMRDGSLTGGFTNIPVAW